MAEDLDSGDRVVAGRYRLLEQLGVGGMSTVWRGEDVVLGRIVAVKEVVFPAGASVTDRAVLRERIRREARATAQLDHPGAVTVHDVVEDGSATYLVMQYVPGPSLSQVVVRHGPLPPQQVARIGLAVLDVLRAAHGRGIVHRDVKPSNVLLSSYEDGVVGRVYLTDFGIAFTPGDSSLTTTGLLIGSPGYIAPERARGETATPVSDLWSLGATLFTTVEGQPPYSGNDSMATLAAVMVGEHAPYVRAGALQPVLERLLERDPAKRITPDELEAALTDVASSPVTRTAPHLPPVPGVAVPDVGARTSLLRVEPGGPGPAAPGSADPRPVPVAPRRRSRRLVWAVPLLAALLGLVLWLVIPAFDGESSGENSAAGMGRSTDPVGLPALPDTARTADEQLRVTISDLEALVQGDPDGAGPQAEEVLARLRQVEVLDAGEQRSTAVVAHDSVGAAVAAGELDADVGQRVQEVLAGVARPERFVDVVELVDADPPAIGPAGPRLLEPLIELDHEVPADQTAARAATLVQEVEEAAGRGEVSQAFADAAVPTLQKLSDPEPYRALHDLLAQAERDPDSIGPAADEVLASLRAIVELPVWPQGNEVLELLELVRQEGRVEPAFRDAAVPVLVPMVR